MRKLLILLVLCFTCNVYGSNIHNIYTADSSVTDHGTNTAQYTSYGDPRSVKDIRDKSGTTTYTTIVFKNIGSGVTTAYPFVTSLSLPDNYEIQVYKGAVFTGAGNFGYYGLRKPSYWGAVGDGSSSDQTAFEKLFDGAIEGNSIFIEPVSDKYVLTSDLEVDTDGLYIYGSGSSSHVHQSSSGISTFYVTADNVTFDNFQISGVTGDTYTDNSYLIRALGTATNYIKNLKIQDMIFKDSDRSALRLRRMQNLRVQANFDNMAYAAIEGYTWEDSKVINSGITDVNCLSSNVGYGIFIGSTGGDPKNARVQIDSNWFYNIDRTNGTDTSQAIFVGDCDNCKISNNQGLHMRQAISLIHSLSWNYGGSIEDNIFDSGVSDGTTEEGINVNGDELTVRGNIITGFGADAESSSGGIRAWNTSNLCLSENVVTYCSPAGILIYNDNRGFAVEGNTLMGCWSDTQSFAAGIHIGSSGGVGTENEGFCNNNSGVTGVKEANLVMEQLYFVANDALNENVVIGQIGYVPTSGVTYFIDDPGNRAKTMRDGVRIPFENYYWVEEFDDEADGVQFESGLKADFWTTAGTNYAAANVTYFSDAGPGVVKAVTAGADNDSVTAVGLYNFNWSYDPVFEGRMKITDISNAYMMIGLASGAFADKAAPDNDCLLVGIDSDNGHGFGASAIVAWIADSASGTSGYCNTGYTASNNTWIKIRFATDDPNNPKIWVDDQLVQQALITQTIRSSLKVAPYWMVQSLSGAADNFFIDFERVWEDRP